MRRVGFTLIELLVVIAIIAVLTAILFPVFASAREKARQTACLSNEKQLATAMIQYTQDYDEYLPGGTKTSNASSGWAGQLYPYVKSAAVFRCPDDTSGSTYNYSSYAINENLAWLVNGSQVPNNDLAINIAKENAPGLTVLLFEVNGNAPSSTAQGVDQYGEASSPTGYGLGAINGNDPQGGGGDTVGAHTTCTGTMKFATGDLGNRGGITQWGPGTWGTFANGNNCFVATTGRHANGSNYIMCDGHVKFLNGSLVSSGNMYFGQNCMTQNVQEDGCGGKYNPAGTNNLTQSSVDGSATFVVTFSYM